MSHEIRHFLVFVDQGTSPSGVLPGDVAPLPLSSALEDHFGARLGERDFPAVRPIPAAEAGGQTPLERPADPAQ